MGILDNMKRSMERSKKQICLPYLGGHPDLPKSCPVLIEREEDHISLSSVSVFSHAKPLAHIPLSDIRSVKLERASARSLGKAAGGAVVGGLLLGPAGALAGGALGGRRKDESIIVITIQYGSAELEILFGTGSEGGENVERAYPKFAQLLK